MALSLNVITAVAHDNFGIGIDGDLPWKLKNELEYFHRMTTEVTTTGKMNAVIMGRRTYFSNPKCVRPFKGRYNIVLSKSTIVDEPGVLTCSNWEEAISHCSTLQKAGLLESVWVIGGKTVYQMALESPLCRRVYLTRVFGTFDCDTFFPSTALSTFRYLQKDPSRQITHEENGIKYQFEVYEK